MRLKRAEEIAMTVIVDVDSGEVTRIVEEMWFRRSSNLFRSDVLQDAMYGVEKMYNDSLEKMGKEGA
jgi:hypothetical protein